LEEFEARESIVMIRNCLPQLPKWKPRQNSQKDFIRFKLGSKNQERRKGDEAKGEKKTGNGDGREYRRETRKNCRRKLEGKRGDQKKTSR